MEKLTKCLAILGLSIAGLVYYFYPERYPYYTKSDHYSPEQQRFFNAIPESPIDKGELLSALWQMIMHKEKFMPPTPLPMEKPNFADFLASAENSKFIWFGHSSILARMGGKQCLLTLCLQNQFRLFL